MTVVDEPFVGLVVAFLEHFVGDLVDDAEGSFDGCPNLMVVVVFEVEIVSVIGVVAAI